MPNSIEPIQPWLHQHFTELITQTTGIVINRDAGPSDRLKLQNRLSRLLKRLELSSFEELWTTLNKTKTNSPAWIEFIHEVTTHKTDFFREPTHFRSLTEHARRLWSSGQKTVTVWSSACSTGEEAVSAAITLQQIAANRTNPFEILATDLDSVVIEYAKKGVYPRPDLTREILKANFLEGRGEYDSLVRVKDAILASIRYENFNLIEAKYPATRFDVIFCRNVLIYFNEVTRERIVTKLAQSLAPSGLLFLGHSESFSYRTDLECVAPTVYRNRLPLKTARRGSSQ